MKKRKNAYLLATAIVIFLIVVGGVCCFYFGKSPSAVPTVSKKVLTIPAADKTKQTIIQLQQNGSTVSGSGASVDENTVCIRQSGTYLINGSIEDGQICVDAGSDDIVILLLKGIEIINSSEEALYVKKAGHVSIQLEDETKNILQSGKKTDVMKVEVDVTAKGAAVYSCSDLSVTGTGSLEVFGYINNGIHTKKNLLLDKGTITVEACNNGIKGKDSVSIAGGEFSITSGEDGIQSDSTEGKEYGNIFISGGSFSLNSKTDAVQAENALEISGGDFKIVAGEGSANVSYPSESGMGHFGEKGRRFGAGNRGDFNNEDTDWDMSDESDISRKGLKSGKKLCISGGTFSIDSYDDAFHSNGNISISGGDFSIESGDDGIHADTELNITGGNIKITKSYEGLEGNQITIDAADIEIVSADDGINAYGGQSNRGGDSGKTTEEMPNLTIVGGTLLVNAEGDGIDSNGNLSIEGGSIVVNGPTGNGNGAIDSGSENGGKCTISGGTILAIGSSGMAETFAEESKQCSFMHNFNSSYAAGSEIIISDSSGVELSHYTAVKEGASVVFSCPDLKQGKTYILSAGGQKEEITLESVSTISGNSRGGRRW